MERTARVGNVEQDVSLDGATHGRVCRQSPSLGPGDPRLTRTFLLGPI
jgi:hypothetical protein